MEILEKGKCVRCGKSSKNGGKGGRCGACLNKLASKRKSPGTKERSWQHADQALRRERGGKGTTTGGHASGHGNRQQIQSKMRNAEKNTGQKLSLDRKNNGKGYESKNTRAVPQNLNRGRHKVDSKKLSNWKKKLKKSEFDSEQFKTLLLAKAYESGCDNLAKTMEYIDHQEFDFLFEE